MAETKPLPSANQAVASGGVGGAIGVILVVMLPKFTTLTFTPDEAALLTLAFGSVCSLVVRYLPRPKG